jgi:methyltransferase
MSVVAFVVAMVLGFMLAEARVSRAHERLLRAQGAREAPGDVYRLMAVLYPGVFVMMGVEGLYRARDAVATVASYSPSWAASGVLLFIASKGLKYWAIRALGERWTFRVLVQPGRPLVTNGPYKYLSHPNYVAVVGEIVSTAMMVSARISGPVALLLFGAVLWARIRVEERALTSLRASVSARPPQP